MEVMDLVSTIRLAHELAALPEQELAAAVGAFAAVLEYRLGKEEAAGLLETSAAEVRK